MTDSSQDMPLVRMRSITKRFGPVTVLDGVDFEIWPGEVHILAGENGAGKSTLIKILGGVHVPTGGVVEMGGVAVRPRSPAEANRLGVSVIFQELSLVPAMTVADNIFLGRSLTGVGGFVRGGEQRRAARELLERLGIDVDVDAPVERLPIAAQQMVEIAKALAQDAKVIVMDEPTSSLPAPDVRKLFALVEGLKERGCGIVYISHKMEEIERIADRITVLRDGKFVGTAMAAELPVPKLIQWMVGRELGEQFPRHVPEAGAAVRLRVEGFSVRPPGTPGGRAVVDGVSLEVRRGEILGIGGLQGSGASELLLGLFGAYGSRGVRGRVMVDGEEFRVRGPRQSRDAGVALLTNDRKATGLVLPMSVTANATLAALDRLSPGGWRRPGVEGRVTAEYAGMLRVRAAGHEVEVGALSGGNQQKVAIAKWLATGPRVLLLDEPTRGIDIGAKRDIYQLMNEWTRQGISIILITSELPELLAMSDRVVVMHRGRITGEFTRGNATPDGILHAAMGGMG